MAGRAATVVLANSGRRARRRRRDRHSKSQRLQPRRQRGLRLFRGQPAAGPALERGHRLPEAHSPPPQFARRRSGPCRDDPVRGRAGGWLGLCLGRSAVPGAGAGRSAAGGRRNRNAAAPGNLGPRTSRGCPGDWRAVAARSARRRRKPAGPPAAAHDLSDRGRPHAQRRLSVLCEARPHGPRLRAAPPRAAHHGALATRAVREDFARLRNRQCRVPRAAAVARPVRRAVARLSGDHRQRLQSAPNQRRIDPCDERRPARRAGNPAQLSLDARGPARRRRFRSASPAGSWARRRSPDIGRPNGSPAPNCRATTI